MDKIALIGLLATVASTASFVPQAWKIIKTRDTSAISTGMYAVTVAAFSCWLTYGLLLSQWPLIVTNGICLVLSGFILSMKLLSPRRRNVVADALDPAIVEADEPTRV